VSRAATAPNIAKRKMPLGQEWATAAVIALVRERVALHESRGVVKQFRGALSCRVVIEPSQRACSPYRLRSALTRAAAGLCAPSQPPVERCRSGAHGSPAARRAISVPACGCLRSG